MNNVNQCSPNAALLEARGAFVQLIKEENAERHSSKWSLAQHWAGAAAGFKDEMLQRRWHDFYLGWKAHVKRSSAAPSGRI